MKYLLDTNAWISFLNADGGKIQQRLQAVIPPPSGYAL
jgi:predicted nucleic acid-binding protein